MPRQLARPEGLGLSSEDTFPVPTVSWRFMDNDCLAMSPRSHSIGLRAINVPGIKSSASSVGGSTHRGSWPVGHDLPSCRSRGHPPRMSERKQADDLQASKFNLCSRPSDLLCEPDAYPPPSETQFITVRRRLLQPLSFREGEAADTPLGIRVDPSSTGSTSPCCPGCRVESRPNPGEYTPGLEESSELSERLCGDELA